MTKRFQITVKGNNVQRCGFRKAAVDMATTLELTGAAMYIDHDILIEIEGDDNRIGEFASWAKTGPSQCNITEVEIIEIPVTGSTAFKVIHGISTRKISA